MRQLLIALCLVSLASCQTIAGALGGAAGAGLGAAIAGPGGAAIGAAGGIIGAEAMVGGGASDPVTVAAAAAGQPQGQVASTVKETSNLIEKVGWWYLLIFVFLPFVTKRGRNWFSGLTKLHDTVSKKDVDSQVERLNRLEGMISSINTKEEK